jgi:hypothetical protein
MGKLLCYHGTSWLLDKRKILKSGRILEQVNNESTHEMQLTEIVPAEYKQTDVNSITEQQTHLSLKKHEKLRNILLSFSELLF